MTLDPRTQIYCSVSYRLLPSEASVTLDPMPLINDTASIKNDPLGVRQVFAVKDILA